VIRTGARKEVFDMEDVIAVAVDVFVKSTIRPIP
jgi:hypothetical protein